jgi:hypothetical protein
MGSQLSAIAAAPWDAQSNARLSLIFSPGRRPSAADIAQLSHSGATTAHPARAPGFALSDSAEADAGWVELLAGGMMFDLAGLAPAAAAPLPPMAHFYGFQARPDPAFEAITLMPGEQLRGAEHLLPVIRTMAGTAIRLAELADVTAVVWHPARCAMAPAVFAATITAWLNGGAFPALGLTALFADSDGAIRSEGLAFFIGRELRIEPFIGKNTTYYAQIATRLINQLVGSETIHQPLDLMGPNGEHFSVEPSEHDGLLRVWRKS